MQRMIVVCGEALIDLFVGPPTGSDLPTEAVPGGSPFNVAVALARLGCATSFLSTVSEDAFGDLLARRLAEAGVDGSLLLRRPQPTALSVVSVDAQGQPGYAFYAHGTADRALTVADLPEVLPADVGAIVAGSYALGVQPSGTALAALLRREAPARLVSLDPNVRPRAVGSVEDFRRRFEDLVPLATIVKASAEDVALLYGTRDLAAVARAWLARGPRLVVITRGEEGPLAAFDREVLERTTPRVPVADTVGAGDTFHAGLLAFLDRAGRLTRAASEAWTADLVAGALDFAGRAAALTCMRRGADPPMLGEVQDFAGGRR